MATQDDGNIKCDVCSRSLPSGEKYLIIGLRKVGANNGADATVCLSYQCGVATARRLVDPRSGVGEL